MSGRLVTGYRQGIGLRLGIGLTAVVILVAGAALLWALNPLGPSVMAKAALESDAGMDIVETSDAWLFLPDENPQRGLVLYPGGRVDLRSYAPLAREIAEDGTAVAVVKAPLSLAILKQNAAEEVMADERLATVESWVVAGHSLGGVAAASFAADNPDRVGGLLLLASYATGDTDLSETSIEVTDVTGELDGVLNRQNWQQGRDRLPEDTVYFEIPGGNHAQFGDYGPQPGDRQASIEVGEQHAIVAAQVRDLFARVERAQ